MPVQRSSFKNLETNFLLNFKKNKLSGRRGKENG